MNRLIKYKRDGTIYSDDNDLDDELNQMLNLNYERLKLNRKNIISAVEEALCKHRGLRSPGEIRCLIDKWQQKDSSGKNIPFYGVALFKLNKHFQRKQK